MRILQVENENRRAAQRKMHKTAMLNIFIVATNSNSPLAVRLILLNTFRFCTQQIIKAKISHNQYTQWLNTSLSN